MNAEFNFPVLLFDGVCNLCDASVQWVLKRDRKAQFRFAALQSGIGRQLLAEHGMNPDAFDSVVLIDGDRVFTRSDAALEILRRLGGFWACWSVFQWIPRPLRDAVYNWVARNRYRWFGREDACHLPRPEWKSRFL